MSTEMLLTKFDGLIQSVNDVEKLEQTIVQWAIQGNLGTQCSEDEPASLLIERLINAKDELEDARKSRRKKNLIPLEDSEIPHKLPVGWQWVKLSKLGLINPRNDISDELEVSFIPMKLVPTEHGDEVESDLRKWGEIRKGYTHFQENDVAFAKITPCFHLIFAQREGISTL